ncbi:MAG: amidohydrolase [Crenarchaeota archaeon]|nr:amidohydrolase [Thermoproteota archaeon]
MKEPILFMAPRIILSYNPLITTDKILVVNGLVKAYGAKAEDEAARLGAEKKIFNKVLAPGFIDTHMHIDTLAMMLRMIDLSSIKSLKELADKIVEANNRIGEWIVGRGFDHNLFIDDKILDRRKLDSILPDKPLLLIHKSGHMGFLNTAGLEAVEQLLTKLPRDQIDRDTGIVVEDALWRIYSWVKEQVRPNDFTDMIVEAQNHILRYGVTGVAVAGCDELCMESLLRAERTGRLKLRVYVYIYPESNEWVEKYLRWRDSAKGRVKVLGVKLLADGALGTRTAYLSMPYDDDPGNRGKLLLSAEDIGKYLEEAVRIDAQVAVHAIGDAALDEVLKAYYKYKEYNHLLRIEHASLVRDDQLEIIGRIKPLISVQPRFIASDKWILERIGGRVKWAYRFRSLMNRTTISFSTDCPVEPIDPRDGIYYAVTRDPGSPYDRYSPYEKISLREALYLYTRTASILLRDERLGALSPGSYADIVWFDEDPLSVGVEKIRDLVVRTISINREAIVADG